LPPDCVEQRDEVERVTTRASLKGGRERRRGLIAKSFARKRSSRLPPQTAGPHHHTSGIGEKFPDQHGKIGLIRRAGAEEKQDGQTFEPAGQVMEPAQRGLIGPVQVVDDE
jgi:hypothetical protein